MKICDYSLFDAFSSDFEPKAFINLEQLRENVKNVKKRVCECQVCAVVKADAYGHGICRVSQEIEDLCDRFAVGSFYEGKALRLAGIKKPIICLLPLADIKGAQFYDIEISAVNTCDFERILRQKSADFPAPKVHFAINSGMNRFGYDSIDFLKNDLKKAKKTGVEVVGVYSHFYNSADYFSDLRQFNTFKPYIYEVKSQYPDAIAHIASSGSIEYGEFNCDMVRIGLLIYGYRSIIGNFNVKPIMKIVAKTAQKRTVNAGENLLYGDRTLDKPEQISILSYGYHNGIEDFYNGLNANCMNVSAVSGSNDYYDLSFDLERIAKQSGDGIYKTLIKAGRVRGKIYY